MSSAFEEELLAAHQILDARTVLQELDATQPAAMPSGAPPAGSPPSSTSIRLAPTRAVAGGNMAALAFAAL